MIILIVIIVMWHVDKQAEIYTINSSCRGRQWRWPSRRIWRHSQRRSDSRRAVPEILLRVQWDAEHRGRSDGQGRGWNECRAAMLAGLSDNDLSFPHNERSRPIRQVVWVVDGRRETVQRGTVLVYVALIRIIINNNKQAFQKRTINDESSQRRPWRRRTSCCLNTVV